MKNSKSEVRIPVYILSEKDSSRATNLLSSINQLSGVELHIIDAVMIADDKKLQESGVSFDQSMANFMIGRSLMPAEIGCAESHNIARRLVSDSEVGGVVLEDDARILDPEEFQRCVNDFLLANLGKSALLSLCGWKPESLSTFNSDHAKTDTRITRLFGKPKLAVAYALTPLAAKRLFESNKIIVQVADWPAIKCKSYVTNTNLVFHGDSQTESTIDSNSSNLRSRPSLNKRLKVFFLLDYFKFKDKNHRRILVSGVWVPKMQWYLDKYFNLRLRCKESK